MGAAEHCAGNGVVDHGVFEFGEFQSVRRGNDHDPLVLLNHAPIDQFEQRGKRHPRMRARKKSRAIGACSDLADLERRLLSLTREEHRRLEAAIEAQRPHFLWDGAHPEETTAPMGVRTGR